MTKTMMVVKTLPELRQARRSLPAPLGLVPTMGYLHEGHLSLVRRAKEVCASVAVSIFVNPAQFGPREDLSRYPRNLERDLSLLREAGVDLVWMPDNEHVYPPGFQTWVSVENLALPLEGAVRPGHFRGVTTVVAKLFNAFTPDRAFFGRKDAQQAAVIRRMGADLNFPVEIEICPTVREADGLAMSSRNAYLNPQERQAATVLFRALSAAKTAFEHGEKDAGRLRALVESTIAAEPLARLQYVSCADFDSLEELEQIRGRALLSLAVFVGNTRLIDNFILE
jgi:pantoate--beta-alanine ligase